MKRWAVLTTLLYMLVLVVLAAPVCMVAFSNWWPMDRAGDSTSLSEAMEIYQQWGFWVWLAIMGLGQALLLLAPVGLAERRPKPRRSLFLPVLAASFSLANLLFAAVIAVLCAIFKEDGFEFFVRIGSLARADAAHHPVTSQVWNATASAGAGGDTEVLFGMALALAFCWLLWTFVFYGFARSDDPASLVQRTTRWLLCGSVLELLVAVPCHIIVRNRNDCCAPGGTFWGIATGISIMLLCFGPGVFFLFANRFSRLKPHPVPAPATPPAPASPPS